MKLPIYLQTLIVMLLLVGCHPITDDQSSKNSAQSNTDSKTNTETNSSTDTETASLMDTDTVTDTQLSSYITISQANVGDTFTFSASAFDFLPDAKLSYQWVLSDNPNKIYEGKTLKYTFDFTKQSDFDIQLIVNDQGKEYIEYSKVS